MKNFFATYDIFLSATLITLNFRLDCLDRKNKKKVCFLFKRDDGLDDAIQMYWAEQLRIEPQEIFTALKMLKSRIYSDN